MKKAWTRLKSSRGFIELEYLMAAGIGLVVIAGFATGIQQMSSMQRRNDVAQDANFLVEDLTGMVKSGDFCTEKFTGITVPPEGTAAAIKFQYPMMEAGTEVTMEEGAEPLEGVKVKTLRLLRVPGIAATKITITTGDFWQVPTVLRIETEKWVNGKATSSKSRDIPLTLSLDAGGKIKYCNKDSLAAQSCFEQGGTYKENPDISKGETTCLPANHCDYGGTFSNDPVNGFPNPLMNPPSMTCPAGYIAERSGTVSAITAKAKYNGKISNQYYGISTCIRCGPTLVAQGSTNGGAFTDDTSMDPVVNSISGVPGWQSGTSGHISSTGSAVGVFPVPPPPPPPPPAPVPQPPTTPPAPDDGQCTGSVYAHPTAVAPDCPTGTTVTGGGYFDTGYGYAEMPMYCMCNNYVPPPPPPTACDAAIANYKQANGANGKCASIGEQPSSITCYEQKVKKKPSNFYVTDSCMNGGYFSSMNGSTPYYYIDPCTVDPSSYECMAQGYPYY